ncbi:hypothetical protein GY12_21755 [Micrococcus luteus]|nr:hypothetical protein GY12_21755 [Micrococcus luteus]
MLSLIEQAEQNWDRSEAEKMARKFADQEDFTLDDFLAQMQQLKKMGSLKKMLMMMPARQCGSSSSSSTSRRSAASRRSSTR